MGHLLGSFQVAASEANTGGLCGRPAAGFKGFDEQGAIAINDKIQTSFLFGKSACYWAQNMYKDKNSDEIMIYSSNNCIDADAKIIKANSLISHIAVR